MDSGQELLARLQTEIGRLVVVNHQHRMKIEELLSEVGRLRTVLTPAQRKKLGLHDEVSEGT